MLDVNLLVALFDPDHIHHELAHDWFATFDRTIPLKAVVGAGRELLEVIAPSEPD